MTPLPNIKLMDALVFTASFLFGFEVGFGVAILSWLVYGFVNLYGQAGPILFFLMVGESFYAVAGAVLRRSQFTNRLLQDQALPSGLSPQTTAVLGTVWKARKRVLAALSRLGKPGILIGRFLGALSKFGKGILGVLLKVGRLGILFGFTGLVGALAYDVFTNTATWFLQLYGPGSNFVVLLGQSFYVGLLTMNFPLPMGLMHQISDLFFFATVVPLAIRIPGRLGWLLTPKIRSD